MGGSSRSASVRNALTAITDDETPVAGGGEPQEILTVVVVHDSARPLVTAELFDRCVAAVPAGGGVVAAAPMAETVKRAGADLIVRETLDRSDLWLIQTPQAFDLGVLRAALDVGDEQLLAATDDASLLEGLGVPVQILPWSKPNIKVTTPADLRIAELLLTSAR